MTLLRNCICESIGTFALTFIGAGAILTNAWTGGQPDLVGIALAHGVALAIAISASMNLSGGHINPAVTAAMLVTRRIAPADAVAYVIAQCLGATVAGVLLSIIFSSLGAGSANLTGPQAITACALGTPAFGTAVSSGMALLVEIILTFFLVFAVFGTAVDSRTPRMAGFGVGLMVMVDILMGGPITGAAMNPARAIGTLIGGGGATSSLWSQHWVYWIGPIAGGILAALIYDTFILKPSPAGTR